MESIIEFFSNNFLLFITIMIFLICVIIGYFGDKYIKKQKELRKSNSEGNADIAVESIAPEETLTNNVETPESTGETIQNAAQPIIEEIPNDMIMPQPIEPEPVIIASPLEPLSSSQTVAPEQSSFTQVEGSVYAMPTNENNDISNTNV